MLSIGKHTNRENTFGHCIISFTFTFFTVSLVKRSRVFFSFLTNCAFACFVFLILILYWPGTWDCCRVWLSSWLRMLFLSLFYCQHRLVVVVFLYCETQLDCCVYVIRLRFHMCCVCACVCYLYACVSLHVLGMWVFTLYTIQAEIKKHMQDVLKPNRENVCTCMYTVSIRVRYTVSSSSLSLSLSNKKFRLVI